MVRGKMLRSGGDLLYFAEASANNTSIVYSYGYLPQPAIRLWAQHCYNTIQSGRSLYPLSFHSPIPLLTSLTRPWA